MWSMTIYGAGNTHIVSLIFRLMTSEQRKNRDVVTKIYDFLKYIIKSKRVKTIDYYPIPIRLFLLLSDLLFICVNFEESISVFI